MCTVATSQLAYVESVFKQARSLPNAFEWKKAMQERVGVNKPGLNRSRSSAWVSDFWEQVSSQDQAQRRRINRKVQNMNHCKKIMLNYRI